MQYAMNSALPDDLCQRVKQVDSDFHCRYDCVGKRYRYKVYQAEHKNPFESGLKTYVPQQLNIERMNEAAQNLLGHMIFTGFCSQKQK